MKAPPFGALVFAACLGKASKFPKYSVKKPAKPDALAISCRSDPVHPIVPVSSADQRKTVAADH
jgi:hypothetical protein